MMPYHTNQKEDNMLIKFDKKGRFWRSEDGAEQEGREPAIKLMACTCSTNLCACGTWCPCLRIFISERDVEINGCQFSFHQPVSQFIDERLMYTDEVVLEKKGVVAWVKELF